MNSKFYPEVYKYKLICSLKQIRIQNIYLPKINLKE